jgi:hypothetical protein
MDWVLLLGFNFAKCHINDIIVLSLTSRDHMHLMEEV